MLPPQPPIRSLLADRLGFVFVHRRVEEGALRRVELARVRHGPFVRVNEPNAGDAAAPQASALAAASAAGPDAELVHQVIGGGGDDAGSGERLEDIAFLYYGDPSAWRLIAEANDIVDPSSVPPGTVLQIPPSSTAGGGL